MHNIRISFLKMSRLTSIVLNHFYYTSKKMDIQYKFHTKSQKATIIEIAKIKRLLKILFKKSFEKRFKNCSKSASKTVQKALLKTIQKKLRKTSKKD